MAAVQTPQGTVAVIHLVGPADYQAYAEQLDAMHRLRYRVFKERLGWSVHTTDGRERDEFDDLDPLYLLAMDEGGEVVGSWRFLPTTGPYMLRDVFSHLLEGQPAPSDIGTWEGSRFAVERSRRRGSSLASIGQVAGELLCSVVETCMAMGVRELITVYDRRMARLLYRMGCPPRRQSRGQTVGQGLAMAGYFDMTDDVLDSIREATDRANALRPAGLPIERNRPRHRHHNNGALDARRQGQDDRRIARLQ